MSKAQVMIKWLKRFVLSVAALAVIAFGYFYIASSLYFGEKFEAVDRGFVVADISDPLEGERLARIRGCQDGCHGIDGAGGEFYGSITPSLSVYMRTYSDAEVERAVRQGIRGDGTSVPLSMPSQMFARMSDEDLGHIIAFFRTMPQKGELAPPSSVGWEMRVGMFAVDFDLRSASYAQNLTPLNDLDTMDTAAYGKYLGQTVCSECHGDTLHGFLDMPDLAMVAAYEPEEFKTLMKTGIASGGREVGLMSGVAKSRFSHFTDDEIAALYSYLSSDVFLDEDR